MFQYLSEIKQNRNSGRLSTQGCNEGFVCCLFAKMFVLVPPTFERFSVMIFSYKFRALRRMLREKSCNVTLIVNTVNSLTF